MKSTNIPSAMRFSQQGVARLLAEKHKGQIWFDHTTGCWYRREGGDIYKQSKRTKLGFQLALELVSASQGIMSPQELRGTGSASFFNGVENILKQLLLEEPRG